MFPWILRKKKIRCYIHHNKRYSWTTPQGSRLATKPLSEKSDLARQEAQVQRVGTLWLDVHHHLSTLTTTTSNAGGAAEEWQRPGTPPMAGALLSGTQQAQRQQWIGSNQARPVSHSQLVTPSPGWVPYGRSRWRTKPVSEPNDTFGFPNSHLHHNGLAAVGLQMLTWQKRQPLLAPTVPGGVGGDRGGGFKLGPVLLWASTTLFNSSELKHNKFNRSLLVEHFNYTII